MSGPKTYLLVPHYDFPADGPIRLGSIILDSQQPGESINEREIIAPASIYTSHKEDWAESLELSTNGKIGLWARCVNILGLGGNFGASSEAATVQHYRFRDLETTYFLPSPTYVRAACSTPEVRSFLEGSRFAPVYLVTGLKIVHGPDAEVTNRRSMAQEGHANLGLHGLVGTSNFALDAGDISIRHAKNAKSSFQGSSDFVFAYRLGKITFSADAGGVPAPKYTLQTAGQFLAINERENNDENSDELPRAVRYEGEAGVLLELDEKRLLAVIDEDDKEECKCFVVQSS